jgi:RNA polymerase sigma factor, sigma-70 family
LTRSAARGGVERLVEPDELAIYAWINTAKPPDEVKRERHRMLAWLAVRYEVYHQVDDIWQDWQLAVYKRCNTGPDVPVEQREAYSFGIARNLCRRAVQGGRRLIPLEPAAPPPEPRGGSSRLEPADGVQDCIRKLRPGVQRILHGTYWEGKASQEVAQEFGLSPDNVRQQLHRARGDLRRCMEGRLKRPPREEWKHASIDE